jgi:hypothetical protein
VTTLSRRSELSAALAGDCFNVRVAG